MGSVCAWQSLLLNEMVTVIGQDLSQNILQDKISHFEVMLDTFLVPIKSGTRKKDTSSNLYDMCSHPFQWGDLQLRVRMWVHLSSNWYYGYACCIFLPYSQFKQLLIFTPFTFEAIHPKSISFNCSQQDSSSTFCLPQFKCNYSRFTWGLTRLRVCCDLSCVFGKHAKCAKLRF